MANRRVIDLLTGMSNNHSNDIVHFERIIQKETGKPCEMFVSDDGIKLYHKITGREIGTYEPSEDFTRLAEAFIEWKRPSLKWIEAESVKKVFAEFNIKIKENER